MVDLSRRAPARLDELFPVPVSDVTLSALSLTNGSGPNLLGSSQYKIVPLIQIASVTGIHGVSFLVVWTSLSLASSLMLIIRRPAWRSMSP